MNFLFVYNINGSKEVAPSSLDLEKVLGQVRTCKIAENARLYFSAKNEGCCYVDEEDISGYLLGYVRDKKLKGEKVLLHNKAVLSEIASKIWPLTDQYTGSFGFFCYSKKSNSIVLANDPIGIYPIYYYCSSDKIVVSSSLILQGLVIGQELDAVAVVERSIPGDFVTFGRRTLLRNVKSLLPGEALYIDCNKMKVVDTKYDNTLYCNVNKKPLDELAETTWELIKSEVELAFANYSDIGIAMSGGLDSRLVLGAIQGGQNIVCCTYGETEFYETHIAAKCASKRGASFESYSMYNNHFSSRDFLEKFIYKTEAVGNLNWNNLLESIKGLDDQSIFTLGDTCDLLTAKNIKRHRSRNAKKTIFLKYTLFGKDIPFTKMTVDQYDKWKKITTEEYIKKAEKTPSCDRSIICELEKDLNELFERIEAHNLPYVELLDELFGIYVHGRGAMSKQFLVSKARFMPLAPIMSIAIARASTAIHPTQKLNFKLFDEIFRQADLRDLNTVPTAQVPFIPYSSPGNIKLLLWGGRSTLDQFLIRLQMKLKLPHFRHRVLKSINWCHVYRQPDALDNVISWFSPDHLNQKDRCIILMRDRAELRSWPLSSYDVGCLGGLNLEIEALKSACTRAFI